MSYEGDPSILNRVARGEGRTGLLVLSGGSRNVIGAAQACALEVRNLRNNFTVIGGGSSGGATAVAFAAGVLQQAINIHYEQCCTSAYLSWSPRRFINGRLVDVSIVSSALRNLILPRDLEACRADVHVAVTDHETGEGGFVDAKTALPDPFALLEASMSMAHIYRRPVYVNGRRYIDANGALVFPGRLMVERWKLDQIIVLANRPRHWKTTLENSILEYLTIKLLPKHLSEPAARRHDEFEANYEYIKTIPHLIMWQDQEGEVRLLTKNPETLIAAREKYYREMDELLVSVGLGPN